MNMITITDLLNYGFVLLFGIFASFSFVDFPFSLHRRFYFGTLLSFGIIQILFYQFMGENMLYKCYPVLIHLPLVLLIHYVIRRNVYFSIISVLCAYLLCTPRKWFGTYVADFFGGDPVAANIAMILVTIPFLLLIRRFVAPHIVKLKYENQTTLFLFLILPLFYYFLEYALTVYTNLLYQGSPVIIEFTDSMIVLLYFILSILSIRFTNQRNQAERENLLLTAAAQQAEKEILQLSQSQKQAAIYRHDLRHHMNYLQSCIQENKKEEALAYIKEICNDLSNSQITRYCTNEPVNLILSSYAEKAAARQVTITIHATASEFSGYQINDLCSLLANALENALNACAEISDSSKRYITLKLYNKNEKLCIHMTNSFGTPPIFENDIPTSNKEGHGIGVQSIISVIEKYQGIYQFHASDGVFCFQACL